MKHIVYRLIMQNRKDVGLTPYQYIGSKSNCTVVNHQIIDSNGRPYYGSSSYDNWQQIIKEENDSIKIEVLKEFDDYTNALNYEAAVQKSLDVVADITYFNLSIATVNSYTDPNYATYKNIHSHKIVRLPRNHPLVISGEYVGVTSGAKFSQEKRRKYAKYGKDNHFYGKHHKDSTKRTISEKRKDQGDLRKPESVVKWIENVAKAPKSKEHREKIGRKGFIMLKNINTLETVRIHKSERYLYDDTIWMNPIRVKSILNSEKNT